MSSLLNDFGPRPFRMFNSWIRREGLGELVEKSWSNFVGYGALDSRFQAKLKHLKNEIKRWRALEFNKENGDRIRLKQNIANLDLAAEVRSLLPHEFGDRAKWLQRLIEIDRCTLLDLKQKSRIKWM